MEPHHVPPLLRSREPDDAGAVTLPGAPSGPDATAMLLPSWMSYSAFTTATHTRTRTTTEVVVFPSNPTRGPTEETHIATRTYTAPEYSIVYKSLPVSRSGHTPAPSSGQPTRHASHEHDRSGAPHRSLTRSHLPHASGAGGAHSSHATPSSQLSSHGHHGHTEHPPSSKASASTHKSDAPSYSSFRSGHSRKPHETHSGSRSGAHTQAPPHGTHSASQTGSHTQANAGSSSGAHTETHSGNQVGQQTSSRQADSTTSFGQRPEESTTTSEPAETATSHDGLHASHTAHESSASLPSHSTHSGNADASQTHSEGPSQSGFHSSTRGHSTQASSSETSAAEPNRSSSQALETATSSDPGNSNTTSMPSAGSTRSDSQSASSATIQASANSSTVSHSSTHASSSSLSFSNFPVVPSASSTGPHVQPSANSGLSDVNKDGSTGGQETKLSPGQIAGITVGSFFGASLLLALISLLFWFCYRRRHRKRDPYGTEDRYTKSGLAAAEKMESGEPEKPQGLAAKLKAMRSGGRGAYAAVGPNASTGTSHPAQFMALNQDMNVGMPYPAASSGYTVDTSQHSLLPSTGPRYPNESASRSTGLTGRYGSAGRAGIGAFVSAMAGRRKSSNRHPSGANDEDTSLLQEDAHDYSNHAGYTEHHNTGDYVSVGRSVPPATDPSSGFNASQQTPLLAQNDDRAQQQTAIANGRERGATDAPTEPSRYLSVAPHTWVGQTNNHLSPLQRAGTQHTSAADTTITGISRTTEPSTLSEGSLEGPTRENSRAHRPSQQLLFARLGSRPAGRPTQGPEPSSSEGQFPEFAAPPDTTADGAAGQPANQTANSFGLTPHPQATSNFEPETNLLAAPSEQPGDETLTTVHAAADDTDGDVLWDGKRHSPEAHMAPLEQDDTSPQQVYPAADTSHERNSAHLYTPGATDSASTSETNHTRSVNASSSPRTVGSASSAFGAGESQAAARHATPTPATQTNIAKSPRSNLLGVDLGSPHDTTIRGDKTSLLNPPPAATETDYPSSATTSVGQGYDPSISSSGYSSQYDSARNPASSMATMGTSQRSRLSGGPTSSSGQAQSATSPRSGPDSWQSSGASGSGPYGHRTPSQEGSLPEPPADQAYDSAPFPSRNGLDHDPYDAPDGSMEQLDSYHLLNGDLWETAGQYDYGAPLDDIEERSLERSSQAAMSARGSRTTLSRQPTGATGRTGASQSSSRGSLLDPASEYGIPHGQPVWRPSPRVRTATEKAYGRLHQHEL